MIARIAGHSEFSVERFPNMEELNGDVSEALRLGRTIGKYLKEYGFDGDFAPVADINTNPENTVIGARAFGSDPEIAAEMVCAAVNGLHESGIASCIKHFPGHGDTREDTHNGYAHTLKTWEEILGCEMITFKAGIEAGTDMVMIAHIAAPEVTGDHLPASLSRTLVTEKLRNELGFNGVIITDSMAMGAITEDYSPAEAAVSAIKAGVDIILMPEDYKEAFDAVAAAVESGEIPESRIDESVCRILGMKEKYSREDQDQ